VEPVTTRFAPSPTGHLHVGNIRTALHNWLLAKRAGGRFMLRIDDTDGERSREHFVDAIRQDLEWLGLVPDGEARQSARFDAYEKEFERLAGNGRIYPCYETPQELELRRKVRLGRGLPPIYDRAALALTDAERAQMEAEGTRPHWRFKLDHASPIAWQDGIRGAQQFDPAQLSDPVIRRADGSWLYMLPSVIDDVAMGITDVLRGEDHVSNTAAQIQMFEALGAPPPCFAHEALLTGSQGKLSKRIGSLSVSQFRSDGIEPEAVVALLARIGTSDPVDPSLGLEELAESFDLDRFGRAPARFDEAELERVNTAIVHGLAYDVVAHRLPDGMGEAGWDAIRPNVARVGDAQDWWRVVTGPVPVPPADEDTRAYLAEAAVTLAEQEWGDDAWHALTGTLKAATGRKGKSLFLPLRQALTGRDHGPDMASLLVLIGREEAIARLWSASGRN
jgi:glutamyl-tRNA synthetase